jgi:hypothetical protein
MRLFGADDTHDGGPVQSFEIYTPNGVGSWSTPKALPFNYFYYPWTFLLPGGDLFVGDRVRSVRGLSQLAIPRTKCVQGLVHPLRQEEFRRENSQKRDVPPSSGDCPQPFKKPAVILAYILLALTLLARL